MDIEFKDGVICIDGEKKFLLSGEVSQYRLRGGQWRDRLRKVKSMGISCISVYFAWNFHSSDKDAYDFESRDRNLRGFLQTAADIGLYVIVRPGPYVCNEWDLGGYPGWLLTEDSGEWRTADPKHLDICREWYRRVNKEIVPFQYTKGGPVILYQVENEHWGRDREFVDGLAQQARNDGIEVPLITNSGWGGYKLVTDGQDIYTKNYEYYLWRGWFDHTYKMLSKDEPMMILEYRAGNHPCWGRLRYDENSYPTQWMLSQTRMLTGMGANLLNYFVIAGGVTPEKYHSHHVCSNYGEDAAISHWGGISDRFYSVRLLAEFFECVGEQLAESQPRRDEWGTNNSRVECFIRTGPKGDFLFPVSLSVLPQDYTIILPDGRRLPEKGSLSIPGRVSHTFVADLEVGDGWRLDFCSAQIMKIWHEGKTLGLVVYNTKGSEGLARFSKDGQRKVINFTCDDEVKRYNTVCADGEIDLFALSTEKAKRAWFLPCEGRLVPLFTNIDLVYPVDAQSCKWKAETSPDKTIQVIAPDLKTLVVNGETHNAVKMDSALYSFTINPPDMAEPLIEIGKPSYCAQDMSWLDAECDAEDGWLQYNPVHGQPITNIGHYQYITDFELPAGKVPQALRFTGISDAELVVYLNGKKIGTFPRDRTEIVDKLGIFDADFDVEDLLHKGVNRLAVDCNVYGRHNCGRKIFAGINRPVALIDSEHEKKTTLNLWWESPVSDVPSSAQDLDEREVSSLEETDLSGWTEVDLTKKRNEPNAWYGTDGLLTRWYKGRFKLTEELKGKNIFLQLPQMDQFWLYVNGTLVGKGDPERKSCFDISRFSDCEILEIAVCIRNCFWRGAHVMQSSPEIFTVVQNLDTWRRRLVEPVTAESCFTDSVPNAQRLVYKRSVNIVSNSGLITPFYVELVGEWREHATVYFNGEFLGLFGHEGPDRRFLIPDEIIDEKNTLMVVVDGYNQPASCGDVKIGTYTRKAVFDLEIPAACQ